MDDTMVYLSENDSYATLQNILSSWCMAPGAKFNLEKTEIILIGTKEHRERICAFRKITINDPLLSQEIEITPDRIDPFRPILLAVMTGSSLSVIGSRGGAEGQ